MSTTSNSLFSYIRKALPYITNRQKFLFVLTLSLSIVTGVLEIILAALVGLFAAICASPEKILTHPRVAQADLFFNGFFSEDPRYFALCVLTTLFICVLCRNALQILHLRLMFGLSQYIATDLCRRTLYLYLRLPYLQFKKYRIPSILTNLNAGTRVGLSLSRFLLVGSSLITLLVLIGALIVASPVVTILFALAVGIGGSFILRLTRNFIDSCAKKDLAASNKMAHIQQMAVNGMREVRLAGKGEALLSLYEHGLSLRRESVQRTMSLRRLPSYSLEAFGFFVLAATMAMLVFVEGLDMGSIAATMGLLAAASWRALPIASGLTIHLTVIRSSFPIWDKLFNLLKTESSTDGQPLPGPAMNALGSPLRFDKTLFVKKVSLRYGKIKALLDVSLEIKKGELLGVVGLSGAGKSSLADILTGLVSPTGGELVVDETVITKENLRAWQMNIACVSQLPYLLDATIAENIALADWGGVIDEARALTCARQASMDFLEDLPRGIHSSAGERGVLLSGGQIQRIAIARALYSAPQLIIFDEATSSLDLQNEKAIMQTILSLHKQVTMIIIAHRLTSVENCDRILWLEQGRVKAIGPPAEVLPQYRAAMASAE